MNKLVIESLVNSQKLLKEGNFDKATHNLRNLYLFYPNSPEVKFALAQALTKKDETKEEAEKLLIELLDTKEREYAIYELGRLKGDKGEFIEAKLYFNQLVNQKEEKKDFPMFELMKIAKKEKNFKEAKRIIYEMLDNNSFLRNRIIFELGKIEELEGNFESAIFHFEQLLDTQERDYALLELGRVYRITRDREIARKYFNKLITEDSFNKNPALLELSKLEFECGNVDLAKTYLMELQKTEDKNYAIVQLAAIERALGNDEEAKNYYEMLIGTSSEEIAIRNLKKLNKKN